MTINLAHADDHIIIRDAIGRLVCSFGDFEMGVTANNGSELIKKLEGVAQLPDICILDIGMPVMNGFETIAVIKKRWPSIKFLVLSMYSDELVVLKMIKSGANGFLVKSCGTDELRVALRAIFETGYYYSEMTTKLINKSFLQNGKSQLIVNSREMEFLSHCCEDCNYSEIAKKMGVSPRTVDGYRDSLFDKLQIKTRVGLAVYAIRNCLATVFR